VVQASPFGDQNNRITIDGELLKAMQRPVQENPFLGQETHKIAMLAFKR